MSAFALMELDILLAKLTAMMMMIMMMDGSIRVYANRTRGQQNRTAAFSSHALPSHKLYDQAEMSLLRGFCGARAK